MILACGLLQKWYTKPLAGMSPHSCPVKFCLVPSRRRGDVELPYLAVPPLAAEPAGLVVRDIDGVAALALPSQTPSRVGDGSRSDVRCPNERRAGVRFSIVFRSIPCHSVIRHCILRWLDVHRPGGR